MHFFGSKFELGIMSLDTVDTHSLRVPAQTARQQFREQLCQTRGLPTVLERYSTRLFIAEMRYYYSLWHYSIEIGSRSGLDLSS